MSKAVQKVFLTMLVAVMLFVSVTGFSACNGSTDPEPDYGPDLSALYVNGDKVLNRYDEPVLLQGVNAGGYLLLEGWMSGFDSTNKIDSYGRNGVAADGVDHYKVSKALSARFGRKRAVALWENFRENYWTEQDFINCAEMGMNVIRLPFSYMSVDPDYDNVAEIPGQKYNFSVLEDFVKLAKKHGLYTILDLHGAYGSQSGKDHSGERQRWDRVDFYSNTEKQQQTVDLWKAVTNHFKGNPNVAAFDILNEPGEIQSDMNSVHSTTDRHFQFFDKVYDAIREIDEDRIIIIESCWSSANLPMPTDEKYNWTHNVIYSFHHYTGLSYAHSYVDKNGKEQPGHIEKFKERITDVNNRKFGVPIYMGEFTCYRDLESWEPTLTALQDAGWHWTTWTYKVRGTSAWGIYLLDTPYVIADADETDKAVADTEEQMLEKWKTIRTDASTTKQFTFSGEEQITLYEVLKTALSRNLNL